MESSTGPPVQVVKFPRWISLMTLLEVEGCWRVKGWLANSQAT